MPSLTDRRAASHVLFTTYSRSPEVSILPSMVITSETTVVVYMPGPDYSGVAQWLLESGILGDTPCLVISQASQPDQLVRSTTVSILASLPPLPAPALLLVGRVASQCSDSDSLPAFSYLWQVSRHTAQKNRIS